MWNKDKSLALSAFCVRLFAAIGVVLCVGAPWWTKWLCAWRSEYLAGKSGLLLVSVYAGAVFAFGALYALHRLLGAIANGDIFVEGNVQNLRALSWLCIAEGLVCLASALYYLPFLLIAVMAAFLGLILRVVKNVFSEAVRIKTENDFTI